jgi:hypothetical protein
MADLPAYPDKGGDDTGDQGGVGSERESRSGTPRWVKVIAILCIVLVVMAGIELFRGEPDLDRLMRPTPTIEQGGQQP